MGLFHFLNKRFYCDLGRGLDKDKIIPENKIKKLLSSKSKIVFISSKKLKKKGYEDLNSRRTREAIQILRENDFIKEVAWRNRVKYFTRC